MKTLAILALVVFPLVAQEKKCDMKTVEDAFWCETCKKVLDKDTCIKEGICKKCFEGKKEEEWQKAPKVHVCVKKYYECQAPCGCKACPGKGSKKCCGKSKEMVSKSPIIYKCLGCEATAYYEKEIKHDEEKHREKKERKIERNCVDAGSFPHIIESKPGR